MDWSSYIPAPVPEDQNIFGVPEMQKWFTGRGSRKGLDTNNLTFPGWNSPERWLSPSRRLSCRPQLRPSVPPWTKWENGTQRRKIRLIKEAVGPVALDPGYPYYTKKPPGEIVPVQIFLQCQTQPAPEAVEGLLPAAIFNQGDDYNEKVKIENAGNDTYDVTMQTPSSAAEHLKTNKTIEPALTLIRNALRRPYARINGDYSDPTNLVPSQILCPSRRLAEVRGAAQCHFVTGPAGGSVARLDVHPRHLPPRPGRQPADDFGVGDDQRGGEGTGRRHYCRRPADARLARAATGRAGRATQNQSIFCSR